MQRTADYTIQGFLYQFNKTLLEILKSPDGSEITVEGIIEDIEVTTPLTITAIQCKYHETKDVFTPSTIFKPLLQMMCHFYNNPKANITYILFAHFSKQSSKSPPIVGKEEMELALESSNKEFDRYITLLKGNINIDTFLTRFSIQFGPSFDELVKEVHNAIQQCGIPTNDIDILTYPHAVQTIANLSIKHNPNERKITKLKLIDGLKHVKQTAITRWTLALKTRKQILNAKRKQLKPNLDKNSRLRYLLIHADSLSDFDSDIVTFVQDYLSKYHFKPAHINTPLLCLNVSEEKFREIQLRLYQKGIDSTDGYIGTHFNEARFFRQPMLQKAHNRTMQREFHLRFLRWESHLSILNNRKSDDLFIIGAGDFSDIDTTDVNVEVLAAPTLKEIKYIMGVSNVYE